MTEYSIRQSTTPDFLVGGGEMGTLIQAMDWSQTPLGAIETWPQSLRTTVSLCLNSNFPISLAWGPQHVQIYNDGYWPICGGKHPDSMGLDFSQCWASAWPVIGDAFEQALSGEACYLENQRMFLDRNGYLEETFFTFSFSPVRDETGGVGGLFHPVTEMTSKIVSERRTRALRDLAARTGKSQSIQDVFSLTAGTLADYDFDIPFALIYQIDSAGDVGRLVAETGIQRGTPASPEELPLAAASGPAIWPLHEVIRTGEVVQVDGLRERLGSVTCGPYPECPETALLLPLTPPGLDSPLAILIAGVSSRLPLDEMYRSFYDLLGSAVTTALANARAYEEERRRAEALAELDRAKTAFFSNVSHEFRTPLTLMLGPVEDSLADSQSPLPAAQRERLEVAHRNSLRLLKLVNTLLDFSRIEAGRVQVSFEPTELAEFTGELASNFRSACEKAGLDLVVECPPLPEAVYVDRDMWEKVVLNLLSNAFKFTLEGEIRVQMDVHEGQARLSVADTGAGVPADEMPKLFERFHRVEGARGRTQEGTGIGLALVHELARIHGGTVWADSTLGEGTTFFVALPFGKAHLPADRIETERRAASTAVGAAPFVEEALRWLPADVDGSPPPETVPPSSGETDPPASQSEAGRYRVLLADDNADMREYVCRLLREQYDVTAMADGAAALRAAQADPPDLVLTDIMMPGLNGFELLQELRRDPSTRELPVLLLSALAGEEARVKGLQAGADDYLTKPFSARELLARVGAHLALARVRTDASERLRESESRFRNMADTAPVIIWVTDAAGECTYLSKQWFQFTGSTPEQSLGSGWLDSLHPDDRSRTQDTFLGANQQREPFQIEYRVRRGDGAYRWAITTASPRLAANRKFLGYIGSVVDISDLKRVEDELREADKRKDEFLAMLAHELRNPLAPIRSGLDILSLDARGVQRETVDLMQDQLEHLVRLVDDLLDLSRIMRGKIELKPEPVTLDSLIEQSVAAIKPMVEEHQQRLELSLPEAPIWLNVDRVRVVQVIENLLNNASKYTPPDGRIHVAAQRRNGQAVLTIEDNGIGIEPELLPRIFDLFTQSHRSLDRSQGGLGIGLTLVKQLLEMHDGTISVSSEGPGAGSTFVVELPVVEQAESALSASHKGERAAGRWKILVVDDNAGAAKLVAMLLQKLGDHEVETAHDGRAALDRLRDFRPDIVLLDIGLPGMDGYAVADRIRQSAEFDDVLLIALTGYGQREDMQRSRRAGFDEHIVKPPSLDQMKTVLAHPKLKPAD